MDHHKPGFHSPAHFALTSRTGREHFPLLKRKEMEADRNKNTNTEPIYVLSLCTLDWSPATVLAVGLWDHKLDREGVPVEGSAMPGQ